MADLAGTVLPDRGCRKEVGAKIAAEAKSFADFMQKANDAEKIISGWKWTNCAEGKTDWLQVVVRSLDHVFALYNGAVRSGQPKLIEQLGNFKLPTGTLSPVGSD